MTTIYFVRHAEPNYDNHDDLTRELTTKGLEDAKKVTEFLKDKGIQVAYSSPYKRAVDTIKNFTDKVGLEIQLETDFRERAVGDWVENFTEYSMHQWSDFDYKLSGGECLREVQERNIRALQNVLKENDGKTLVIGTHGTALSMIMNRYQPAFGYEEFLRIKDVMPWIVRFTFNDEECKMIEEIPTWSENHD
ncbi:MAG: histidine phosphatase family protein [Lachnospiraceae bacterium]|jgi:2,3-bisphosphoglycerate-dependent phosphoglycerate mutase|nr:histidine phosphatase family protein [Lachnospiraceae bacterium]